MGNHLEYTLDKFTFAVATERLYSSAGLWAKADGTNITIGVSDFFQQRNGDVAFAELPAEGTTVAVHEGFVTLETIKVNLELPCPVSGVIVAANEALDFEAELINMDPYGAGWLVVVEATDWAADAANLLTPEAFYAHMKLEAQAAL